jgi:hypothetical protein
MPMLSRRHFLSLTAASYGLSVAHLSAQRGRGGAESAGRCRRASWR